MAPRQSSKSLGTSPQTALAVVLTPAQLSQEGVALASERNFYKNKVKVLELDLARLQKTVAGGDNAAGSPDHLFQQRLDRVREVAGSDSRNPVPKAQGSDAILSALAASNAVMLQRQAANHQFAMATAEVRLHQEMERAGILDSKLAALRTLQRSPPYRVAKRISRWGRFWKRLARRSVRGAR